MTTPQAPPAGAPAAVVEITRRDMLSPTAVACPNPKMPLWSNHPRVFLDVAAHREGRCPYCGTLYRLAPGVELDGAAH